MSDLTTRTARSLLQGEYGAELQRRLASSVEGVQSTLAWGVACAAVESMDPAELGIIAAIGVDYHEDSPEGRTPLYVVHCGAYCDEYRSGRYNLEALAATALVARLFDLVREAQNA